MIGFHLIHYFRGSGFWLTKRTTNVRPADVIRLPRMIMLIKNVQPNAWAIRKIAAEAMA